MSNIIDNWSILYKKILIWKTKFLNHKISLALRTTFHQCFLFVLTTLPTSSTTESNSRFYSTERLKSLSLLLFPWKRERRERWHFPPLLPPTSAHSIYSFLGLESPGPPLALRESDWMLYDWGSSVISSVMTDKPGWAEVKKCVYRLITRS